MTYRIYGGTLMDRSNLVKPQPPPRGYTWVPSKRTPVTPSFEMFLDNVSEGQRRKAARLTQQPNDGLRANAKKFGEAEQEAFMERQSQIIQKHKKTMDALHKEVSVLGLIRVQDLG